MQIFLFQNKKKEEPKHPDYVVKDTKFVFIGAAWEKEDKNGERYITVVLNNIEE